MPNHFSAIGFTVDQQPDLEQLLDHMTSAGETLPCDQGVYLFWSQSPGIELWINADPDYNVAGCNPHFSGAGRVRVGVAAVGQRVPRVPLESTLMGHINPTAESLDGDAPIVIDMPDYAISHAGAEAGSIVSVQVAAFANELKCYTTDAAYSDSQSGEKMKFAPEFYIPSGMFTNDPAAVPRANAMLAGHVQESSLVTNPHTGRQFHHLVISSLPGTLDVVADPEIVVGQPVAGGVVSGSFWLSGRIVDA